MCLNHCRINGKQCRYLALYYIRLCYSQPGSNAAFVGVRFGTTLFTQVCLSEQSKHGIGTNAALDIINLHI